MDSKQLSRNFFTPATFGEMQNLLQKGSHQQATCSVVQYITTASLIYSFSWEFVTFSPRLAFTIDYKITDAFPFFPFIHYPFPSYCHSSFQQMSVHAVICIQAGMLKACQWGTNTTARTSCTFRNETFIKKKQGCMIRIHTTSRHTPLCLFFHLRPGTR